MSQERADLDTTQYTLMEHLTELRGRLLKSLLAIVVTTLACAVYAPVILDYSVQPLRAVLAERSRVETLVVNPDGAAIGSQLREFTRARYRGQVNSLKEAAAKISTAANTRYPIDLVLISTSVLSTDGSMLSDLVSSSKPFEVAYLTSDPSSPQVIQWLLEGVTVLKDPPRTLALKRVVGRAAATVGKGTTGDKLVVLSPLEPFFAYLKIALVCGLFLACPFWIYQAWAFIAPGLYRHEKRFALPVVLSGSLLFVTGGLFAYYVMFPLMFDVLVNQMMPASLAGSFTVDNYLGLLMRVTIAFGVVFELPLALALLAALGLVNAKRLRAFRRYAYVVAFVVGAVLTPADPLSQSLMALPLIVFYEVGIFLAILFEKRNADESESGLSST